MGEALTIALNPELPEQETLNFMAGSVDLGEIRKQSARWHGGLSSLDRSRKISSDSHCGGYACCELCSYW